MRLRVSFSEHGDKTFKVQFQHDCKSFDARLGEIQTLTEYVGGVPYDGEYTITPKLETQTIPTKEKVMLDDVTVKSIPYFEMDNNNGTTVFIGNEV